MNASTVALGRRADAQAAAARLAIAAIFFVNGLAFASWVPHIPTVQGRLGLSTSLLERLHR